MSTQTPHSPRPADADCTPVARGEAVTLPPADPSANTATLPQGATTAAPFAVPQRVVVPGYEILGELGRGGMGVVYQARQLRLDRLVALKMILAGSHAGAGEITRFAAEAAAVALLQHPHIVQIYDTGEHEGRLYLSLEFCPGGSLDRKLAGTPLPPDQAVALVQTLAQAVHAAHQAGILHRDLKPANVLLAADGQPKITDFGLAKKLHETGQTASGAILGTPSYMAPEQAGGKSSELGPAADVYALGAILYECLTGRPPFRAATPLDTLLQVASVEPVPPRELQPGVPRDLETICLKCLQKEPGKRYTSAAALADDLRNVREGRPIRARPTSRAERAWRWCRRNPVVAGLAATLAAVLVVGLATVTLLYFGAESQRKRAEQNAQAAVENLDEATQQRERAQASYRMARAALEKVVKLRDDPRLRSGPLEDLKQQLAQAEAGFYEEFLRLQGDDPAFQAERARAFAGLGAVLFQQGKMDDALRDLRQAIAIDEALRERFPDEPAHARRLAADESELALVCLKLGLQEECDRAYRRVGGIYEELLKRDPPDAKDWDAAVICQQNQGVAYRNAGRLAEAEQAFRRALAFHDRQAGHGIAAPQATAGIIWNNLAELYQHMTRPADAADAFARARSIWEDLTRQEPGQEMYRLNLAGFLVNFGNFLDDSHRLAEAIQCWEQAQTHYDELVHQHPADNHYRHGLAMTHDNLGMALVRIGQPSRARPHYDEALALWARLHADNPGAVEYISDLGGLQRNLGDLAARTGETQAALDWFARAIATLETSPDRRRDGSNSHRWLRDASFKRAALLTQLSRHAEALPDWDRVVELEHGSRAPTRLQRTQALARAGQHAAAEKEAAFLAGLPDIPTREFATLATILSLCIPAVQQDKTLTAREQDQRIERLATQAVEWLRRASDGGFVDLQRLQKDPDLEALRDRPEFQKLVEELRGRAGEDRPGEPLDASALTHHVSGGDEHSERA